MNQLGKLINRIPGSRLLISSLPGLASRTHVESLGKPRDVNKRLKSLPGKLDVKYSLCIRGAFGKFLAWSYISVTDLQTLLCLVSF